MKNNLYLLLALVVTMLIGCKPKNIDIDDALKQISEETFAKTPSRSYLELVGNDLLVVEYTFDNTAKTAMRKEVSFLQNAAFEGMLTENFTYAWGDFKEGMYGRSIFLTGGKGNRTLSYLNNQLNDGEVLTTISEPRADMVANMIDGLTAGSWTAENPTYVLQYLWVDTTIYEYHRDGKKYRVDTIFMRMPRPNYFDTIGVDSCFYYTYTFEKGTSAKVAKLTTDFKANIVIPDTAFPTKYQDPNDRDTIVTYTIQEGQRVFRSAVDYTFWTISDVKVTKDVQSMDVLVGEADAEPVKLSINPFLYQEGQGAFVLDQMTYIFTPKN